MSFDLFTCCTGADDEKYIHPCACPTTSLQFQSEHKDCELCGWEISQYFTPATPPNKYKQLKIAASGGDWNVGSCYDCDFDRHYYYSQKINFSGSITYHAIDDDDLNSITCDMGDGTALGARSTGTNVGYTLQNTDDYYGYCDDCPPPLSNPTNYSFFNVGQSVANCRVKGTCNWAQGSSPTSATSQIVPWGTPKDADNIGGLTDKNDASFLYEISDIDTEQDAINRKSATLGTLNSSVWSTRSTGYYFTHRTCAYTINCSNLFIGFNYKVTPSIRKRTAITGSSTGINYGTWENVEVTPYTFTATATTETINDNGDPIDLDLVQGYQYQVTGATIEKV
jgi:hypothetical protein